MYSLTCCYAFVRVGVSYLGWSSWRRPCRPHRTPRRSGNPRPRRRTPGTAAWPQFPAWTHTSLGFLLPHTFSIQAQRRGILKLLLWRLLDFVVGRNKPTCLFRRCRPARSSGRRGLASPDHCCGFWSGARNWSLCLKKSFQGWAGLGWRRPESWGSG